MTDIVERLEVAASAYPADVFGELTEADRRDYGNVIQRAAASMGRHLSPLLTEAAAEIVRLRGEVEALRQCGVKYLGWLGVKNAEKALREDMADPEMVDRPAPAMPNGVEGLVEALRGFPEEPNPYTYRIAYAKAQDALRSAQVQWECQHDWRQDSDNAAWDYCPKCRVSRRRAQAPAPKQQDMGGFTSDTAALAFLHLIGNGNPNVEAAVERLRTSLIAKAPVVRVTDEMVRRAEIVREQSLRKIASYGSAGVEERHNMAMRAALEAALGQGKANG